MRKIVRKPNFFILGAPKCGTTSLAYYLSQHPNIFMSNPKETFYFSPDILQLKNINTKRSYLKLFRDVNDQHIGIGEASVTYLVSNLAVPAILEFIPNAKFIVCLRHPVDMVYSLHSYLLFTGVENIEDFKLAWLMQNQRYNLKSFISANYTTRLLCYSEQCRLGFLLERLFSLVSRESVLCIFLEDLTQDPKMVYEMVLNFLNIESDNRSEFPIINENKVIKSAALKSIYSLAYELKLNFISSNLGMGKYLHRFFSTPAKRPELDPDFRQELLDYFKDDIIKLASLTERDLSHWLKV